MLCVLHALFVVFVVVDYECVLVCICFFLLCAVFILLLMLFVVVMTVFFCFVVFSFMYVVCCVQLVLFVCVFMCVCVCKFACGGVWVCEFQLCLRVYVRLFGFAADCDVCCVVNVMFCLFCLCDRL